VFILGDNELIMCTKPFIIMDKIATVSFSLFLSVYLWLQRGCLDFGIGAENIPIGDFTLILSKISWEPDPDNAGVGR